MTQFSTSASAIQQSHEDGIKILGVLLILARHIRMIVSIPIVVAAASIIANMMSPVVYSSSAKLIVLEFVDQSKILRIGDDGKIVYEKKHGIWKPADPSIIKNIIEGSNIKKLIDDKYRQVPTTNLENNQYTIKVKNPSPSSTYLTVTVESKNKNTTKDVAVTVVEESIALAFRMGLVSSPLMPLDAKLGDVDAGTSTVVRLLEAPVAGTKIVTNQKLKLVILTLSAFMGSVFLAFVIEYFKTMDKEKRKQFNSIRAALKRNGQNGR